MLNVLSLEQILILKLKNRGKEKRLQRKYYWITVVIFLPS